MCGRFQQTTTPKQWQKIIEPVVGKIDVETGEFEPSYNVAPTDPVAMIARSKDSSLKFKRARWGLVPSWSKDTKQASRYINARGETALDKTMFAKPLKARRCLIPVDSFYEWKRVDGEKKPYRITYGENSLVMGGIYDFWKDPAASDPDDGWHVSCSVLTVEPNKEMSAVHDRMPVILPQDAWEVWLDHEAATGEISDLIHPLEDDLLDLNEISTAINSSRNKGPEVLEILG